MYSNLAVLSQKDDLTFLCYVFLPLHSGSNMARVKYDDGMAILLILPTEAIYKDSK